MYILLCSLKLLILATCPTHQSFTCCLPLRPISICPESVRDQKSPKKQVTTPKTAWITFLSVIGVWYLTDNHKSSSTFPCLSQSHIVAVTGSHLLGLWMSKNRKSKAPNICIETKEFAEAFPVSNLLHLLSGSFSKVILCVSPRNVNHV